MCVCAHAIYDKEVNVELYTLNSMHGVQCTPYIPYDVIPMDSPIGIPYDSLIFKGYFLDNFPSLLCVASLFCSHK